MALLEPRPAPPDGFKSDYSLNVPRRKAAWSIWRCTTIMVNWGELRPDHAT
jgi:hypothetical protein